MYIITSPSKLLQHREENEIMEKKLQSRARQENLNISHRYKNCKESLGRYSIIEILFPWMSLEATKTSISYYKEKWLQMTDK